MIRTYRVIPKLLAAALALAAAAAQAQTWTTHPGAGCTSDGSVNRPTNGSLLNYTGQFTGYSTFSCPVPRNFADSGPVTSTYVYVNFKASDGPAAFYCVLRSVDYWGDIIDSDSLTVPKAWQVNNIKNQWGGPLEVNGSSTQSSYSVILRCQVPNYPATPGGIISYMVRH